MLGNSLLNRLSGCPYIHTHCAGRSVRKGRVGKPATEMTEEEINAFAEEMYNRIMGTLPERKVADEK